MRNNNITTLPADLYIVVNKTIIQESDRKIITMLYQPIIGFTSVSLYFTLVDDLDKLEIMSDDLTHHHLMTVMQLSLDKIVEARERLEAVGLLKTYVRAGNVNNYVYQIYSPISANEFFNHPILSVVLYNNIGKKEYENAINYYKIPRLNLKDYTDITASFDEVFKTSVGRGDLIKEDIARKTSNKLILNKSIDFDMLISSIPKSMMHEKCFRDDVKGLINSLSYAYNIDTLNMLGLVRDSINEKGLIDQKVLRKSCRNYYQFENGGKLPTLIYTKQPDFLKKPEGDNSKWAKMVYTFENITPYDFLKSRCKGAEPTSRDLRLIDELLIDQKLNAGVVNVLIYYVLKINNQKLNKSYIEAIAGQWKRLNIETVEEAMKITEKEHKKNKRMLNKNKIKTVKSKKREEELPAWFNEKLESADTTSDEAEEMERILNELA